MKEHTLLSKNKGAFRRLFILYTALFLGMLIGATVYSFYHAYVEK